MNAGQRTIQPLIKKLLLPGLLLVVVAILARFQFLRPGGAPSNEQDRKTTMTASAGEFVLACPGRMEGLSEAIDIGAGIEGVLAEVRVQEGQTVAAGDVVALIACDDLKAELQSADRIAEAMRQARQRLLRGSREEERRIAAAEVEAARAMFKQLQLQQQRMAGLFEKGDVAREAMEKARRDVEVAEASLRAKTDYQQLTNAPPLPEELAKADAEVQAADEKIKLAGAKLGKCVIRAPAQGTVLRRHLNAGEVVSALSPRPILSMADLSRLRVRAEVDERDVGRIYRGQLAQVLSDAAPNGKLSGRVTWIGTRMGRKKVLTGNPAEKSDRDVLEVLVELDEKADWAIVGLRVTVQFIGKGIG
ncbi:MAG: HlyD family efflux transporter periplasmic adaptor subunit [Blastocatellia bacterium]|nr:HlyD family efflux transporter periplasmic adaptor subunit [Blastocatellia bacterium]